MASPPLKLILSPDRLGPKGDGICQSPEGTIYIERSAPFDKLRVKIFKDLEGVSRGEILEILEPSTHRQSPSCPHYSACGNCTLLHLTPQFYREWKTQTVKEAFLKTGLKPQKWLEPIFLAGYNRRRATFTVLKKRGKIVMGYYRRRSQEITEIETCEIAHPKLLKLKKFLNPYLPFLTKEGAPLDLFFQVVGNSIDMVMTGPIGKTGRPDDAFIKVLQDILEVSDVARVSWRNESQTQTLIQKDSLTIQFGSLKVELPPAAFLQPTIEGEKTLVDAVLKALPSHGTFADLFSGCGTFTGPMLRQGSVEAFESDLSAIKNLSKASRGKKLKVYQRDLFKNPIPYKDLNHFDAIVFNPPRAGCPEQAQEIARSQCPTLIGISCNPATFARDAKILCRGGYQLKSLQVIDQFLGSHHVEVVGVFSKSK